VRRAVAFAVMAGLFGTGLSACSSGTRDRSIPNPQAHAKLLANGSPTGICVAVARTRRERNIGLSFRLSLPSREGMAFIYSPPSQPLFYMKETAIPLVVVWVAPDGRVLGNTPMAPYSETLHPAPDTVAMTVELAPADWADLAPTAKSMSLGGTCQSSVTAGYVGSQRNRF
jgi:uncharacterized protein